MLCRVLWWAIWILAHCCWSLFSWFELQCSGDCEVFQALPVFRKCDMGRESQTSMADHLPLRQTISKFSIKSNYFGVYRLSLLNGGSYPSGGWVSSRMEVGGSGLPAGGGRHEYACTRHQSTSTNTIDFNRGSHIKINIQTEWLHCICNVTAAFTFIWLPFGN